MEKKVCSKCKEEKDVTEFYSGRNQCKLCVKEYKKEYKENNKQKIKDISKKYREKYKEKNKEKIKQYKKEYIEKNKEKNRKYNNQYREKNKEKINIRLCNRRQSDPTYRLIESIKSRINESIRRKGYTKKSKTYDILGCTYNEFKLQIESQWEEWMNWDNYGKYNGEENYGWDFDHIIPISSGKCEEDIIRLNHHSNIQPLCSYINRYVKRDKIEKGLSNVFDIVE